MAIKEIKGRTLPGRSEEPSPDRSTTTISEPEGKRAASEQQRERSEFEQRQRGKTARRPMKKGPPLEKSEFESGERVAPRLTDPADDLGRYPDARSTAEEGLEPGPATARTPEEEPEPVLWGDRYDAEETDDAQPPSEGDEYEEESPEEEGEDGDPSDLWATGPASKKDPGVSERPQPPDVWDPSAPPDLPIGSELIPGAPKARPYEPVIAARTMEVPAVGLDPSGVLAPIPRGAVLASSDPPTQEITAVDDASELERLKSRPLGEDDAERTETVPEQLKRPR